ncbi:MAG: hypothetical protein ACMUIU_04810 [bacterium]
MKIVMLIKMFLLFLLTFIVMIMLMPAVIFGGTKFIGEVYRVFIKEFNKIRGLKPSKLEV